MGTILDSLEKDGKQLAPTFAFVDPFGFSGIPFDLTARILAYPSSFSCFRITPLMSGWPPSGPCLLLQRGASDKSDWDMMLPSVTI
jgi:hypothetical protein